MVSCVVLPPDVLTLYKCPPLFFHVVKAISLPLGDQVGCASVKSFFVNRFGVPFGKLITYKRFKAVNAIFEPSGDGTASLIWVTIPS